MMRLAVTLTLLLLGLALAGCASSGGKRSTAGQSHAQARAYNLRVVAGNRNTLGRASSRRLPLFVSPQRLAIATWGSSNCLTVPAKLTVLGPDAIRIDLTPGSWRPTGTWHRVDGRRMPRMRIVAHPPTNGICLADRTDTPMVVSIPSQINVHHRLTIRFYYPLTKKPFIATVPPL
jgi:hypothetical protein